MKLELGAGYHRTPGFDVYMDINPDIPDLDYVGDASEPLPWDDDTFDEIRAVDVLEHISYTKTMPTLVEWARVLMPGGRLYVQVPDTRTAVENWLNNPNGQVVARFGHQPPLVSLAWRLMGGHFDDDYTIDAERWRDNAHFALFDASSICWFLMEVGLVIDTIQVNGHPNLLVWASKPI